MGKTRSRWTQILGPGVSKPAKLRLHRKPRSQHPRKLWGSFLIPELQGRSVCLEAFAQNRPPESRLAAFGELEREQVCTIVSDLRGVGVCEIIILLLHEGEETCEEKDSPWNWTGSGPSHTSNVVQGQPRRHATRSIIERPTRLQRGSKAYVIAQTRLHPPLLT